EGVLSCLKVEMKGETVPHDPKFLQEHKCAKHCFMVGAGFIANNNINPKKISDILCKDVRNSKKVKAIKESCHHLKSTEKCELGSKLMECYTDVANN
ncbi:hypothetical protein KR067_003398, partial [Drosophila pandora]